MKIFLCSNMNNLAYRLARAFISIGHECLLLVDSDVTNDRPEFYDPELKSGYPEWIKEINVRNILDFRFGRGAFKELTADIRSCDCMLAGGFGPILGRRFNLPSVFLSQGADLEYFANWEYWKRQVWKANKRNFSNYLKRIVWTPVVIAMQRWGIRGCKYITYYPKGIMQTGHRAIESMHMTERHVFIPFPVDIPPLAPALYNPTDTLKIFWPTRHIWGDIPAVIHPEKNKRNDIFIRGLYEFLNNLGSKKQVQLEMVQHGPCFSQSMSLIEALDITSHIHIQMHKPLPQKELYMKIIDSDVIVDQFGCGWIGTGGLEYMALGKPLIAYVDKEIAREAYGEEIPVANARTPGEVAEQLMRLQEIEKRLELGKKGRSFVEKQHSTLRVAKRYLELFES